MFPSLSRERLLGNYDACLLSDFFAAFFGFCAAFVVVCILYCFIVIAKADEESCNAFESFRLNIT